MPIPSTARLPRTAAVCCLFALSLVACSSVLGIEQAECYAPQYADCRAESPLCTDYCTTVMANCHDDLAQYTTMGNCLAVCAHLPAGSAGDTQVDSIECRLAQAKAVPDLQASEQVSTCAGAGPGGNGACGDVCTAACTLTLAACTGSNAKFMSFGDCYNECSELTSVGQPYNAAPNSPNMSRGPSPECRLWHSCAATEAAIPHCSHANGESTCI